MPPRQVGRRQRRAGGGALDGTMHGRRSRRCVVPSDSTEPSSSAHSLWLSVSAARHRNGDHSACRRSRSGPSKCPTSHSSCAVATGRTAAGVALGALPSLPSRPRRGLAVGEEVGRHAQAAAAGGHQAQEVSWLPPPPPPPLGRPAAIQTARRLCCAVAPPAARVTMPPPPRIPQVSGTKLHAGRWRAELHCGGSGCAAR